MAGQTIQRHDYQAFEFDLTAVDLIFDLGIEQTEVQGTLTLQRRTAGDGSVLRLHGQGQPLRGISVDGHALDASRYRIEDGNLLVEGLPDRCELMIRTSLTPGDNTALEGLYCSADFLLTQCEAEGFRRILYFPDRPDVMSVYRVTLNADRQQFPVLLSNGNCERQADLEDGRHQTVWFDPAPKPSYLFALVAGDLDCLCDQFTTSDGRDVALKIYAETPNMGQLDYAMASLKRSMAWDEQRFGLAYDLDVYHIVVTNDFNMGAMENKSLNIFNSKYVLASRDTATDRDYQAIEAVIGHEYFHNWTGNRITCQDWFQLSLKEGLTVFRDQEFTADMQSRAVKRIEDVRQLRSLQFPEDSGPMAHPVRPDSYQEINNFYTVTVYEKGAEVVRMLHTILTEAGFHKGMREYVKRHDGQAVTCDDFRLAMAEANNVDLSQFERWYSQAGTPELSCQMVHDPERSECHLTFSQHTSPTADGSAKQPFHIPVRLALLNSSGEACALHSDDSALEGDLFHLTESSHTLTLADIAERPVPSILCGFSAPVHLSMQQSGEELAFLMAHDPDSFNRWEAGQTLAQRILMSRMSDGEEASMSDASVFIEAMRSTLSDRDLDPALVAETLSLPDINTLLSRQIDVNPVRAFELRQQLQHQVATACESELLSAYHHCLDASESAGAPSDSGKEDWLSPQRIALRSLQNQTLSGLAVLDDAPDDLILAQYLESDSMTEKLPALAMLVHTGHSQADAMLDDFLAQFQDNALVVDKWLVVQATSPQESMMPRMSQLMAHPAYQAHNPNKIRSLVGAFSRANPVHFHAASGEGYAFLADQVLALDAINPQVTSRLASAFNAWKQLEPTRRNLVRAQLQRIANSGSLSPDVNEVISKALARSASE